VSEALWEKGRTAARSARLLVDPAVADPNSAVSRAYFAMFHAARAALATAEPSLGPVKRHATVIGRFGRYMVKDRGLDVRLGRELSLAFDLRTIADYEPVMTDIDDATELVGTAEAFVEAVEQFVRQAKP
jgi:uncharacterized protein (UPF0332 family)